MQTDRQTSTGTYVERDRERDQQQTSRQRYRQIERRRDGLTFLEAGKESPQIEQTDRDADRLTDEQR